MTNTRASLTHRLTAALTSCALFGAQLAPFPSAEAAPLGSSTASAGSAPPPGVSAIQSFQPDLFTGRATTSIPIAVPPGRKGMQPSLALAYSSSARNGWVGVGWSLDLGYIERSTKNGVPKYDATDTYTFMFQGITSDLVNIDGVGAEFRAKDEGLFLRFKKNSDVAGWEIRDKSGTRYLFGQTAASQIEALGKIFRWSLEKVIDTNGNTLLISYTKDQGQLYLSRIDYTGHETGLSQDLAPANRVDFTLEPAGRPDIETTDRSGFAITTAKRLATIETRATVNSVLSLARRYQLAYIQSARTGRSLLSSVTQVGSDGTTSLPPTTFTYTSNPPTYLHCDNCVPSISSGNHDWQLQYQVGNLFPRDDGGNDQRLWPSGSFDPGQKSWQEQVCQDIKTCHSCWFFATCCDHQTICQLVTNYGAIPPVSWGNPILDQPSGSSGGVSWSTDLSGNLSVNGPPDTHILAMTWLYTTTATNVSLSSLSTNGRADVFYVQPGGGSWSVASGNQVPLNPGWTVVAVTAYNEIGSFNLSMSANLASQVTAMNHAQFSPMGLTGDFNGDGITDLAHVEPAQNHWHVALNSPSGFGQEQTWLNATLPVETVPLVGDVDADGKADLILWNSSNGSWQVAKSTGSSFSTPTTWHSGFGAGQTPFVGDVNGDGFLDVGTFSGGTWTIALSNGTSFGGATTWLSGFGSGATPLIGDFNGDGLTDVAVVSNGTIFVALSNGTQLVPQPTAWATSFGSGQSLTSADVNGDGLTDVIYYDKATGTVVYAASTGQSFGAAQTLMSEHPFSPALRTTNDTLQVGDFRGNGISGFGVFNALSGAAEIAFALGIPPDLLETTANGLGGGTQLSYQPSSQFTNTNLPFAIPVVTKATTTDGLGHSYTTTYRYTGGLYDASTKEFRGFQTATVTDARGTTTATTFAQDLHTKGRPLSVEIRDSAGHLFTKTVNTWSCTEPQPGVHFPKLDQIDSFIYDGDSSFRQTRSRFSYDPYGNIAQTNEDGQIAPPLTGDERTTMTTFTYNTTAWMLNKPALTQTLDANSVVVAQRRFYYDGATATTTAPTLGNLTKEEEWLNLPTEQWPATSLTYDAYGNVATVTDALGRVTTNTYDASGTYLTQITNALGHTRTLTYDPRFGQVTSLTDQNGQTTTTTYDALGRPIQTGFIDPATSAQVITSQTTYDLSSVPSVPSRTTTTVYSDPSHLAPLTSHLFTDGLGRTIQTRSPAQDPTKHIVTGAVEFDVRGQVAKQWAPYLDAISTSYVPASLVLGLAPPVSYTYDPIGRLLTITDPDGSVTATRYDDGTVTTTDASSHKTSRTTDAYGRLSVVEEFLETESAVTTYAYDALNNLTLVVDARGHETLMHYDSLGRKLSMDDPDMGHWTYAYDAVGNLTSQTDARGVTITFTYDALNRLTQKSYADTPLTSHLSPVTYTYDDPLKQFSKGKLTGVTDGSGSSTFDYDNLGRLIKESKTIDTTPYTIQRSYDLLGRLTSLTYPDNEKANYTYNLQGGIASISLQPVTGSPQAIVSSIDYNAAGQITKITYGNGVVTDYSYNPQTLRLSSLATHNASLATLQDFSYAFDPLGNVTGITDRVHTATQSFQYDALNRLTQATGSYGTSTYSYDPIGNMTSKEGVTMTYGLPDGSKPHAVTATAAGWAMSYDANGNMLSKTPANDLLTQQFAYDAENRLVQVQTAQEDTETVTFQPGWNFFSLPVIPDNASVAVILPNFSQNFEQIAKFDPATNTFKHYVGTAKFDDFTTLDYGVGYQVYCKATSAITIPLKGRLPTRKLSKSLSVGWQLLGSTTLADTPVATWLTGVAYTDIREHNPADNSLPVASQAKSAKAYWVKVSATSTWSPPLPKNVTTQFVYDGDGGKVKQTTASGTTTYLGDVYEKDPAGKTTKYVFAGSLRIANKASDGTLLFYHTDHLGSSDVITDATGVVVEHTEHLPYGAISRHDGPKDLPHQFTGQRQDAGTGLILFPARAYDPQLGRFIQPDPFVQAPSDPQTLNRYSYVRNNPINFVDLSGYFSWKKFFGIVAAVVVSVVTGNPELGLTIWGQLLAVSAAAAAGSAVGGAIDRSLAGSGSQSSFQSPVPQSVPSPPFSPALVGPGSPSLGIVPMAATASIAPLSAEGGLGALTAGELAVPGVGEVVGGAIVGILLYHGAAALREAYEEWDRGFEVIGYHATSQPRYGASIHDDGFNLEYSNPRNRFGRGFYLASTPEVAVAEYQKHHGGQSPPVVLRIRARLTRNLTVSGPLAREPLSRRVGAAVRAVKGSITYGSFAPGGEGGINYVLFNPLEQIRDVQVESLGTP